MTMIIIQLEIIMTTCHHIKQTYLSSSFRALASWFNYNGTHRERVEPWCEVSTMRYYIDFRSIPGCEQLLTLE